MIRKPLWISELHGSKSILIESHRHGEFYRFPNSRLPFPKSGRANAIAPILRIRIGLMMSPSQLRARTCLAAAAR